MARSFAVLAALYGLSACASSTMEDTASPAATQTSAVGGDIQGEGRNTGTFPNLNVPPAVAAEQITPEEKEAKLAELNAEKQQQAAEGASARPTTSPAELKKVASTHAQEALKQIEGE
jgi:hypothetical protein